jgi:hypothetical protein
VSLLTILDSFTVVKNWKMAVCFPPNAPIDAAEFFDCRDQQDKTFSPKNSKSIPSISYTDDGRKLEDGLLIEPVNPEELWKEVIVRKLSHQIVKKAAENDANSANE